MIILTEDERDLLHQRSITWLIMHAVANPDAGIASLRTMCAGGRGGGFEYETVGRKITGRWRDADQGVWTIQREVSITFTRLHRWTSQLPDELRARARVAWATHPVWTRDLDRLARITHEAIDLDPTAPIQLDLFGAPA